MKSISSFNDCLVSCFRDFGLATSSPLTNIIASTTVDVVDAYTPGALPSEKSSDMVSSSGHCTGQVGTALYVAPELKVNGNYLCFIL